MTKVNLIDESLFAPSTEKGQNRFWIKIHVQARANKTIRILRNRHGADFSFRVDCEYPSYDEERLARKDSTDYDEFNGIHVIDQDKITLWRIRRCIVRWDLHKYLKSYQRLHRVQGELEDDSMEQILKLPPPLRKYLVEKLWEALGGV